MTPEPPKTLVWDDQTLSRFWSYYAQFPEAYFSYHCGDALVAHARRRLRDGARVLDYGCGPGQLLPPLLDAGFKVTGAELSEDTMAQARAVAAGRPNFEGLFTIDQLLVERRRFDAVFLVEVVEHLDDAALDATFSNILSLLETSGLLMVTTPNEERLQDNMVYCPVSNLLFHRWQHVRSWSGATLAAYLKQRGFSSVETETHLFETRAQAGQDWFRRMRDRWQRRKLPPTSLIAYARP